MELLLQDHKISMQDAQNGLMDVSVTVADGKLSCSFIKAAVTELVIPDHENVVIDLDNKSYFLELAWNLYTAFIRV